MVQYWWHGIIYYYAVTYLCALLSILFFHLQQKSTGYLSQASINTVQYEAVYTSDE